MSSNVSKDIGIVTGSAHTSGLSAKNKLHTTKSLWMFLGNLVENEVTCTNTRVQDGGNGVWDFLHTKSNYWKYSGSYLGQMEYRKYKEFCFQQEISKNEITGTSLNIVIATLSENYIVSITSVHKIRT